MAESSQMARSYLKNLGYKDEDISYQKGTNGQQGTINLAGKFFANGNPEADGYIRMNTSALDTAMNAYKGNQTQNQLTEQGNNAFTRQNDLLGQYEKNIMQPIQPFTYDPNQIRNSTEFKSAYNNLQQGAQRATNQSLVDLGRRGIGNSQSAVVSANAQQQNVENTANNELMPRLIAEAYNKYVDQNNMQNQQNQNILGLANTYGNQYQQSFDNTRALGQDQQQREQINRANFESDRSYNFAVGQQEWDNNFKTGQFDFQKAQQIWDNTFQEKNFQQSMNEAAASRGLQWASLNQRDKEFIADQAYREQQFTYQKALDEAQVWQKTREMDLTEKKLSTTEKATYNEAMQKAMDLALKDPAYLSAKDQSAKNTIIDSYYNKLAPSGMTDSEIAEYLK